MGGRVRPQPVGYAPGAQPVPAAALASAKAVNAQIQGLKDHLRRLYKSLFFGERQGGLPAGGVIWRRPFTADFTFPVNFTNKLAQQSRGIAGIAATAQAVFSIQKNGVQFGTMTFAAAATTATFAAASATSFASGDVLTIVAPNPADATLEGVAWDLVAEIPE